MKGGPRCCLMRALQAVATLAALAFAGCSDGGETEETQGPFVATETTGILQGVVVDEAIRPLAGATLTLSGPTAGQTATAADGLFGFDGLAPGSYFVKVHKAGYFDTQTSTDVVAGVKDPKLVRIQLLADPTNTPFVEELVWEGFIECGTDVVALCAVPNFGTATACGASQETACAGNVTNDRFDTYADVSPNIDWIQSEMVWESTQTAGENLFLTMRFGDAASYYDGFFNGTLNSTQGTSPLLLTADGAAAEAAALGSGNGLIHAVFGSPPEPGLPVAPPTGGVVVEQEFTVYTHVFHGYRPPADWRFSTDSRVPPPL